MFRYGGGISLIMELLIKRLQSKEAEIAQYLTIIESLQQQLNSLKEENDQCTKNEKNQKKENANDGKN